MMSDANKLSKPCYGIWKYLSNSKYMIYFVYLFMYLFFQMFYKTLDGGKTL